METRWSRTKLLFPSRPSPHSPSPQRCGTCQQPWLRFRPFKIELSAQTAPPRRQGGPRGVWVVVLRKVKMFVHGAYKEDTWWGIALPCTGLRGTLWGGCLPLVFHPYGHQQPVRPTTTSKTNMLVMLDGGSSSPGPSHQRQSRLGSSKPPAWAGLCSLHGISKEHALRDSLPTDPSPAPQVLWARNFSSPVLDGSLCRAHS